MGRATTHELEAPKLNAENTREAAIKGRLVGFGQDLPLYPAWGGS